MQSCGRNAGKSTLSALNPVKVIWVAVALKQYTTFLWSHWWSVSNWTMFELLHILNWHYNITTSIRPSLWEYYSKTQCGGCGAEIVLATEPCSQLASFPLLCNGTANDHPAHTFSLLGPFVTQRFDGVVVSWSSWNVVAWWLDPNRSDTAWFSFSLKITHHSSPITHHSSLITHHPSLITHHSSLITHQSINKSINQNRRRKNCVYWHKWSTSHQSSNQSIKKRETLYTIGNWHKC